MVRAKMAVWADRICYGDFRPGLPDLSRPVSVEFHIFVPPVNVSRKELLKQKGRQALALNWWVNSETVTDVIEIAYEICHCGAVDRGHLHLVTTCLQQTGATTWGEVRITV